ncbi:UDP-N-acetylmuramoyl-L-alanine--D-glutamate ligase [Candidatus Jorgensenbacteria bacterium]|nr:UDP-N-acetylmuramoyl-L-alanine--D-glutamate ligase [Candidatus Jorgensenbacteria bacterium]
MINEFNGKKVLIVGLGILGGGVATAKWFVREGARVTVTDLRRRIDLVDSIKKLGQARRRILFVLGKHRLADLKSNDVVVVNPAVPRESVFLKAARDADKTITNDAGIFFDIVKNPIIAVTGTRGKTTTSNWIGHFLAGKHQEIIVGGNTPEMPLLDLIDKLPSRSTPVVLELSSWQLELIYKSRYAPDVAVITNIYRDHLNRYSSMRDYVLAKANIFKKQLPTQKLVLNYDNSWTDLFLKQKPRSDTYFFSNYRLPLKANGLSVDHNGVFFQNNGVRTRILGSGIIKQFSIREGNHGVSNLLAAMLASYLAGVDWSSIIRRIKTLSRPIYREQVIMENKLFTVINDSAATSPDATLVAIQKLAGPVSGVGSRSNLILIAGGTDKKLDFTEWAKNVKKHIFISNLFLLNGSATRKMIVALSRLRYFDNTNPQLFEDLQKLLKTLRKNINNRLGDSKKRNNISILFSPGAASFEKFKNEFDRGRQFTIYSKQLFKK